MTTLVDTMQAPVLESGDRLTREEFHCRYLKRPDLKKAELVEGVVYVGSPVRVFHAEPHPDIVHWLSAYRLHHRTVRLFDNVTVILGPNSEVQPDACLIRPADAGGRAAVNEEGYIEGAPDLVVEIAASSASYDLHDKVRAYQRAGVLEYLVWRVLDRRCDWFRLSEGRLARVEPDAAGVIESAVFPGLRLAVPALLAGDLAAVLRALGPAAGDR